MSLFLNRFANVLVVFSTSTVVSLALEWMFGDYQRTTDINDVWIQFFSGISQFFIYAIAAPEISSFMYSATVYGPPGMTASLCFFWGILFQTNMRAKIMDWYQIAVDPSMYKRQSTAPQETDCSSGECPSS
jgi:hypothetical protein